ncbi:Spt4/RpoE2 zinc finger protein [Ostreococcus tauri]|uniref:Spt4/RpoE2 zinc finger protein n=1 Tax=Ostreococcus tauri TaxID=70448 RepID=A0A1Y5HX80_OSTTA|nr:Spt4/RpoE2 zinc finger protein [Ostreococcus tauri]
MQPAEPPLDGSTKRSRACRRCGLVNTFEQFLEKGCENCPDVIANDRSIISEKTTQLYSGLVSIQDGSNSWVATWLRKDRLKPGCYALSMNND